MMIHRLHRLVVAALPLLLAGCAVIQVKPEGRVASDQLLISLAAEDAVRALDLDAAVADKTVKLTVTHNGSVPTDLAYITQALRARVLHGGGRVWEAGPPRYDLELVAMVQTIGSDIDQSKVSLPVPLPTVGSISMSEVAFYEDSKQIARCRLWVFAVDKAGNVLFTHEPVHYAHRVRNPVLLGVTLGKWSDVKELDHTRGRVPVSDPGMTRGYTAPPR